MDELDFLHEEAWYCNPRLGVPSPLISSMVHPVRGGVENAHGKVNILLQSYITKAQIRSFSLISDMSYVAQNASRILRALFEVAIRKNMPSVSAKLLMLCKSVDKRLWSFASPMRQVLTATMHQLTEASSHNSHLIFCTKLTITSSVLPKCKTWMQMKSAIWFATSAWAQR